LAAELQAFTSYDPSVDKSHPFKLHSERTPPFTIDPLDLKNYILPQSTVLDPADERILNWAASGGSAGDSTMESLMKRRDFKVRTNNAEYASSNGTMTQEGRGGGKAASQKGKNAARDVFEVKVSFDGSLLFAVCCVVSSFALLGWEDPQLK
jgi:hypothetical protein